MSFINSFLGISTFPRELQNLSLKYFCLQVLVSGIYLSHAWISLYYLSILDSFNTFGLIVAIGMLFGAILDFPLGILTDYLGQRIAFFFALFALTFYYFGLIFATKPIEFLILEIMVGIYSALISGSYISWFLNSWEYLSSKETKSSTLFRNVMGNITFAKTLIITFIIFIGGLLLQQGQLTPQTVFFLQAIIAVIGIFFGIKFITNPNKHNKDLTSFNKHKQGIKSSHTADSLVVALKQIVVKNSAIIPFFISFSFLSFTSVIFSSLIFSPLLYEFGSVNYVFNQNDIIIRFSSVSIILITGTRSFSNFILAISSRLSGKITSKIYSPYKGLIIFYIFEFPVIWFAFLSVLIIDLQLQVKLLLYVLIFLIRVILAGLTTSIYWHLYYKITTSGSRSSQESLFNTIYLIVSLVGFGMVGKILETYSFLGALIFLFFVSCLGIFLLLFAKNPDLDSSIS